jgi:hypothetical protein
MNLPDLHDATLTSLHVDWGTGDLRITFLLCAREPSTFVLRARGLTSLTCPRRFPWGSSASVNHTQVELRADEVRLVVEMQSGDEIEVAAKELLAAGAGGSPS